MELREFFVQAGGDYDKVLSRLPAALIKKFVCRFAEDPSYDELKSALEEQDFDTAFRAAHTLKGVSANLGMDDLAVAASELTEELRDNRTAPRQSLVETVDQAYQTAVQLISVLE